MPLSWQRRRGPRRGSRSRKRTFAYYDRYRRRMILLSGRVRVADGRYRTGWEMSHSKRDGGFPHRRRSPAGETCRGLCLARSRPRPSCWTVGDCDRERSAGFSEGEGRREAGAWTGWRVLNGPRWCQARHDGSFWRRCCWRQRTTGEECVNGRWSGKVCLVGGRRDLESRGATEMSRGRWKAEEAGWKRWPAGDALTG